MASTLDRIGLILGLRRSGISDTRVLRAMELVPREQFVDPAFVSEAYRDCALPIECGQTISQPFIVAYMTEKLAPQDGDNVLEIGTGSGYQSAVLSHLCGQIHTIERYRELQAGADKELRALGIHNVTTIIGDGWLGWPPHAPYDRIMVTAATEEVPETLLDQLRVGGRMVLPMGPDRDNQVLVQIDKTESGETRENLIAVRFVPLVKGRVKREDREEFDTKS